MLIVCFSGTEFLTEWLDDFDIRQTKSEFIPEDHKILLHIQHYNFYNTLRKELLECIKEHINDNTVLVCTPVFTPYRRFGTVKNYKMSIFYNLLK